MLEVDTDAVHQVAQARLHEDSAVGVGPKGKQFAQLRLEVETTLVDGKLGHATLATDDFAVFGSDAFAKNADTVALHIPPEEVVAIGREQPVRLGLVAETAADGVAHAKICPRVKTRNLKTVGNLKHRHRDRLFHNVFGTLCRNLQRNANQKQQG